MRAGLLFPTSVAIFTGSLLLACANDTKEESETDTQTDDLSTSSQELKKKRCRPSRDYSQLILNGQPFANDDGLHATLSTRDGFFLDTRNPFFKELGTNGRVCATCHEAQDGWSISASHVQKLFEESCGEDPIFRTNDGSNNPNADVSTLEAKRAAYSLLLNRGLIRIHLPIPANAQFRLVAVDDPYGNDTSTELSLFRRPTQATNLRFSPLVMWDGREENLLTQARTATTGHAEGAAPSDETLQKIVDFETALYTSQVWAEGAGFTGANGATGDVRTLSVLPFTVNQNHPFPSCTQTVPPSCNAGPISVETNEVFNLYDAWADARVAKRAAIARGEVVFNTKRFVDPAVGPAQPVTCSNCHNNESGSASWPKAGPAPFGGVPTVGISAPPFRAGLPLYTFESLPGATTPTGAPVPPGTRVASSDPGMALRTGLWRDMNRFKTPSLRGLAAHPPYFHNGLSPTIAAVVDHYDTQFTIGFTDQEKSDLTAFLAAL